MNYEELNLKLDDARAQYKRFQYHEIIIYIEITIYNQEKFLIPLGDFDNFPDEQIVQLKLPRGYHIISYDDIINLDYYIDKY